MTHGRLRILGLSVLVGAVLCMPASAHHSVSGQFDVKTKVVLAGTVERVDWVNPHIYVHLKVKDEQGHENIWRLNTVPVGMARAAGITKESLFAEGKIMKITIFPARDGTKYLGFATRFEFPDGKFIQTSPDRE
jgi:hypothetical protein